MMAVERVHVRCEHAGAGAARTIQRSARENILIRRSSVGGEANIHNPLFLSRHLKEKDYNMNGAC